MIDDFEELHKFGLGILQMLCFWIPFFPGIHRLQFRFYFRTPEHCSRIKKPIVSEDVFYITIVTIQRPFDSSFDDVPNFLPAADHGGAMGAKLN